MQLESSSQAQRWVKRKVRSGEEPGGAGLGWAGRVDPEDLGVWGAGRASRVGSTSG